MTALLALLAAFGAACDDEAEIRSQIQKFFAAANRKDSVAALRVWSPASPEAKAVGACVKALPAALSDVAVEPPILANDLAYVLVRFTGRLTADDSRFADEKQTRWFVSLRREAGTWKWFGFEPEANVLARELVKVPDRKQRREILEGGKEVLGERLVQTLFANFNALAETSRVAELRVLAESLLDVAEITKKDEDHLRAEYSWGYFLTIHGSPGSSVTFLRRAKAFAEKIQDAESIVLCGAWLGYALGQARLWDEALQTLEAAVKRAEAPELAERRFLAQNFAAEVNLIRGSAAEGLVWGRRALATAESLAKRDDLKIQALDEVSRASHELGDYNGALDAALAGLALATTPEEAPMRVKFLNTRGMIDRATGDLDAALKRFDEAHALWKTIGVPKIEGKILNNIGEILRRKGEDLPRAIEQLTAAVQALERDGDRQDANGARCNIGHLYRQIGAPDEAALRYVDCLDEAKALKDTRQQIVALVSIADLELSRDHGKDAFQRLEEALPLAEKLGQPSPRIMVHVGLSHALHRRKDPGDLELALLHLRKAEEAMELSRSGLRDPILRQGFLSRHSALYSMIAEVLHDLKRGDEAFAAAERGKARTLVDLLAEGSVRIVKSMTPQERAEEATLEAGLHALTLELETKVHLDEKTVVENKITRKHEELEEYRRDLFRRHPELAGLRGRFAPASLQELNRSVLAGPQRRVLLSYLIAPTETFLFVVTPGRESASLEIHRIPVTLEKLTDDAQALWAACEQGDGVYRPLARSLHQLLLEPAAKSLAGVEHLIVIPDGVLHLLPFQVLQDAGGSHLIERCSVTVAPSATALLKMEEVAAGRRTSPEKDLSPLFAVGDPTMPKDLAPLANARAEIETLAKAYGVPPLLGPEATETAVKKQIGGARRVLIATHGVVREASPLYSYVVLARDDQNDGRLHAREIVDLDLRADLVVLSACHTARGREVAGEGVVGLPWAMFAAGTPATVLSQWQVDDASTRRLMEEFFGRLKPGTEFASALRQAQLVLMKNPATSHPFFWAPFLLIGTGRG